MQEKDERTYRNTWNSSYAQSSSSIVLNICKENVYTNIFKHDDKVIENDT